MQTQSKHMLTAEGRLPDNRTGPQGQRIWILPSAYSRSQDKGKWHLRASRTTRKSKKVKSLFSCNYGLDYSSKAEAESQASRDAFATALLEAFPPPKKRSSPPSPPRAGRGETASVAAPSPSRSQPTAKRKTKGGSVDLRSQNGGHPTGGAGGQRAAVDRAQRRRQRALAIAQREKKAELLAKKLAHLFPDHPEHPDFAHPGCCKTHRCALDTDFSFITEDDADE